MPEWAAYARKLIGRGEGPTGILTARRSHARFPCGAVCFWPAHDMRHGLILTADHFTTMDLLYPQAVLLGLVAGLEPVAREFGCSAVRATLMTANARLIESLHAASYELSGPILQKTLANAC
jgi:hypothetical protein